MSKSTANPAGLNELAVWREGDVLVVRREEPLPPICVFSGQPARRYVKCLFHWQERPLAGGGVGGLFWHYARDVWKVPLNVPLSDNLMRRRTIGWLLFGLTALLALATIGGLVGAQVYLSGLAAGPERKWWNDLGVPIIAMGGVLLTCLAMIGSYKIMPMPTVRLKAVRASETHLWLSGAAPEYLAQLPERKIA
jgi:hypothetical protein